MILIMKMKMMMMMMMTTTMILDEKLPNDFVTNSELFVLAIDSH